MNPETALDLYPPENEAFTVWTLPAKASIYMDENEGVTHEWNWNGEGGVYFVDIRPVYSEEWEEWSGECWCFLEGPYFIS